MRRKKTIAIDDRDITVKELSVSQVRELMDSLEEKRDISTIDMLFPDGLPAEAIAASTGISVKKLEEEFTPSEIKQIIEAVENLNPFFANMMKRMISAGREILKEKNLMPPAAV